MTTEAPAKAARLNLVGYWLNSGRETSSSEIKSRLDEICHRHEKKLVDVEIESGVAANPLRRGLWAALRKLVCYKCPTRQMNYGIVNIEDFITQAMAPCSCQFAEGLDGIVINGIGHLCSDPVKGSQLVLFLAEHGKHVVNEDGICISCCHPVTKQLLYKRSLLVSNRAC